MKGKIIIAFFLAAGILLAGCTQPSDSGGNNPSGQTYSMQEVNQHNLPSDCWIVLRNRVYNVTELISKTPDSNFSKECGKDASQGFGFGPNRDSNSGRPPFPNDSNRPRQPADFNRQRPPGDFNGQRPNGFQNPLQQYYIGDLQP